MTCPPSVLDLRRHLRLCTQRCTAAETLPPCVATGLSESLNHSLTQLITHLHVLCCMQHLCCSLGGIPTVADGSGKTDCGKGLWTRTVGAKIEASCCKSISQN
jgi:hypothetical protein